MNLSLKMIKILILHFLCVSQSYGNENRGKTIIIRNCSDTKFKSTFTVAIFRGREGAVIEYAGVGTLVNEFWVLTSSNHFTTPVPVYTVVAGAESVYVNPKKRRKYLRTALASEFFLSPKLKPNKKEIQIALLKLNTPITANKMVSFIRLATYRDLTFKKLEDLCRNATAMSYGGSQAHKYEPLRCPSVSVIPEKDCVYYDNTYKHETGCVDGLNYGCQGYIGAPLVCRNIQFGVINGIHCGTNNSVLFTKIYGYSKFIKRLIDVHFLFDNTPHRRSSSNCNNFNLLYLLTFMFLVYIY